MTDVYLWITEPNNDILAAVLVRHHYPLPAASVRGVVGSPDKQRAGVYGTAQQDASFLTNRQATRWVSRITGAVEFHPTEFATGTVAVREAAEDHAKTQPSGRLATPMVVVLDEAANVCRWNELPNLYSHYGSRGVNMLTFLQSWSQGVDAWGRDGMRKL